MSHRAAICCLLLYAAVMTWARAQEFDERSIPEPTSFASAVAHSGAEVRVIGGTHRVKGTDSGAAIEAVELAGSQAERLRGVRVSLEGPGGKDQMYLDAGQAAQLRDELLS